MTASPEPVIPTSPAGVPASASIAVPTGSAEFGRAAMAILVAMVLLIVALTGILVETTWRHPASEGEVPAPAPAPASDPGSFARR